ncbi:heme A synthase [Fulvivirga sp. RKSG066]|uniref:COX15/CtaA family protein n=1 Tax=Fulvivirga aurantia TaxID=2529383 RepID=UPI0012BD7493|nr:COX15/CtaA family protein [Fulvivirga aurantia]MTI22839.1 heme A synthase [Fulvivirga aurantia]
MIKNKEKKVRRLSRFSLTTLIAVYFLILVGGIVRSTGSGMGCPDWPKCFGQWVPPTEVSQLPSDYKEIYSAQRQEKNKRFAKYLTAFGFEDTAKKILEDESIKEEADFNSFKTWTEYINRLIGVLIGLFIIGTFWYSIPFLKTNKTIFFTAMATLLLVIFQGWIGSIVVSTNLLPWMITIHMFIALIIVALLVFIVFKTKTHWHLEGKSLSKLLPFTVGICLILSLVQIAMGTQVREAIDQIAIAIGESNRSSWVKELGTTFIIHRSFSWVIIAAHAFLVYLLGKEHLRLASVKLLVSVIILSVITGVSLNYLGFPAIAQPMHLLLGTMAFGIQFLVFLQLISARYKFSEVRT